MTAGPSHGRTYIVGSGLAGLSAAVRLAGRGAPITLIEAAMQAGGRCRSYHDPALDMTIDNGNHLVLSGNRATFDYLAAIGAVDQLHGLGDKGPAFHDLRDGSTWTLWPNPGPLAWWILDPGRRVLGTKAADYLGLLPLLVPGADRRIDAVLACEGALWDRLIGPFLLGALNTDPRSGSASLAGAVMRRTFARGGRAYRSRIAHPCLAAAFVEPALGFLARRGVEPLYGRRVRGMEYDGDRVVGLRVADDLIPLRIEDRVILATPPWIAQDLVPDLIVPDQFSAIVNAHFKMPAPAGAAPMLGVIGGAAEWVFAFADRLSVTVSGADAIVDEDRHSLAERLWADVATVHRLPAALPPWQIVKERRATFAATPQQNARRPPTLTRWRNLQLAGDWTRTGLPATIEGAIQSGAAAADARTTG